MTENKSVELNAATPKREGELFKVVVIENKEFPLYYGYYEECDRENPLCEPIPIYPDFIKHPIYNDEGFPFVTDMQDACENYRGARILEGCFGCEHYKHGADFFGICMLDARRQK